VRRKKKRIGAAAMIIHWTKKQAELCQFGGFCGMVNKMIAMIVINAMQAVNAIKMSRGDRVT
jgi:hypothetical protein